MIGSLFKYDFGYFMFVSFSSNFILFLFYIDDYIVYLILCRILMII